VISGQDAVSADPAPEAGTLRGACWGTLKPLPEPTSIPPSSLERLADEPEDKDDEALTLGPVEDLRPDRYKRRTTTSHRPIPGDVETLYRPRYRRDRREAGVGRRADSDGVPAVCGREDADREGFICTRVAGHAGVHVYERHRSERLIIPRRFGDTFAAPEQPQGDR
jgi:hypothetical protein